MIKILFAFIIAFSICFFGIKGYRELSNKDKWALTKLIAYSAFCAIITIVFLTSIVILF